MAPAAITRLLELTRDINHEVKIAAIYALGEGADPVPAAVTRLLELTRDINNEVKVAAIRATGRISRRG
ncbi:MAG: HEAT repeat domain-containing protein [Enterobacteriaceae bacterium]|nr:HEAT repeat domain-containing protein [Enterobacteriaceae bacterium]